MMYDIERIRTADSVSDAIGLLAADPESIVVCGGSDVLIKIREGKLAGCSLVSIFGLKELKGVRMEPGGTITIGPGTSFSHITDDPIIRTHIPVLGHAVDQAGGPQLRKVGTIGGNLCNGMTSADSAATLLCLNATLEVTGPAGVRTLRQEDFYAGPGRIRLEHGELLTAIRIAREDYEGFGGHYIKYAMRNAMDIATLGCAVNVRLSADKKAVEDLRLAFGVAAPTPIRCRETEAEVKGRPVDKALLDTIGEMAVTEVNPRTSWRASKEFRIRLVRELSRRATAQAIVHGGGKDLR